MKPTLLLLATFFIINLTQTKAQSSININGNNINQLDQKKRKQNEWIYFNDSGYVVMSCFYKDDVCISPMVFFENADTAFVKLPRTNNRQHFVWYRNKEKYYGTFVFNKDSVITQMEEGIITDSSMLAAIHAYRNIVIPPVYYFAQKKLQDYISASFNSADLFTNHPLDVILTISTAGLVTNVAFSNNKFMITENQERELRWLYTSMPRWQPFFYGDAAKEIKIELYNRYKVRVSGGRYDW